MIRGENNKTKSITRGFRSLNRFTSPEYYSNSDLYVAENVDLSLGVGKVVCCNGYGTGVNVISGTLRGFYGHIRSSTVGLPIAHVNTTIYYWNGTAWTASGLTTLASNNTHFASYLDYIFVVDGTIIRSSLDGATWGTAQLTSAPASGVIDIEVYKLRLYLLTPTAIFYSSIPDNSLNIIWNSTTNFEPISPYDGDFNTGMRRLRERLIIFKNYATYRYLQFSDVENSLLAISENVGCPNAYAHTLNSEGDTMYFFGTQKNGKKGIYMTVGEKVQLISRPVQDILDGVSNVSTVRAEFSDGKVKFFLGNITLKNGKVIVNCELQYCTRDSSQEVTSWQWRTLPLSISFYANQKYGSTLGLYFGTSNATIYPDETGLTFAGVLINSRIEAIRRLAPAGSFLKARELIITGENLADINVYIESDALTKNTKPLDKKVIGSQLSLSIPNMEGSKFNIGVSWQQKTIVYESDETSIETIDMGVNPQLTPKI